MPKIAAYSRDNVYSRTGLFDKHLSWLNQELLTTSNPTFNDITATGDAVIGGSLTVLGNATIISSNITEVSDNIILINSDDLGPGVTLGIAGIEIERGTLGNYQTVYQESSGLYKIGPIGDLHAVATREDTPLTNGIMVYNNVTGNIDSVSDIVIPLTLSGNTATTSSSTGTLKIVGGLGITGDLYTDSGIHFKGTNYINSIKSDTSNNLVVTTDEDLVFDILPGNSIIIPTDAVLRVSNSSITSDSVILDITNPGGDILITPKSGSSIKIPVNSHLEWDNSNKIVSDGTNLTVSAAGSFNIQSSSSITGALEISTLGATVSQTPGQGVNFRSRNRVITTSSTSNLSVNTFEGGTINTSATLPQANTVYITGAPTVTNGGVLTSSYSLNVNSGASKFGGQVLVSNTSNSTSTNSGSIQTLGGLGVLLDTFIGGNLTVNGTSNLFNVNTVTITTSNNVNITGSVTVSDATLVKSNLFRQLGVNFIVTPTTESITTTFDFTVPDISTNFSNSYSIKINCLGFFNETSPVSISNLFSYTISGTKKIRISFTSSSNDNHVISLNATYDSN